MGEVIYSVNGKNFKDYGIRVSASSQLGMLKRKPVNSYNWAEYHGLAVDLDNPKYEAREITLDCFIAGNSYEDMYRQFKNLLDTEFSKSGTQRLLIEPFGLAPLPYEVFTLDEIELKKTFKDGRMIGTFTIKMIEPNPIKKVLKTTTNAITLSYSSSLETEIFWGDGTKSTVRGNASVLSRPLAVGSIVVIAGNIEQITNFSTNAAVLWERL